MSHSVPSALQTTLESDAFALATLVKVIKPDGTTITITNWDEPLTVNLDGAGALVYSPVDWNELTALSTQINAAIDDGQLKVPLNETFTADDIRQEEFAGAQILIGHVSPADVANPFYHLSYRIGQTNIDGAQASFELLGMEKALETPVGYPLTANCKNFFGDAGCGITVNPATWASTTAYALGTQVKPTAGGNLWFRVTTAGTSGGSEPSWISGTVNDGSVVWTSIPARKRTGTVSSVTTDRSFAATGVSVSDDYYGNGELVWLTGDNAGQKQWVRSDDGAGNIALHFPPAYDILVGDTFEATVGCRKRLQEDCVTKHANALNSSSKTLRFNGDPYLTVENVTLQAPVGESDDEG